MRRKGRSRPCVRVTHVENRTPTGRRTATPARRAADYFALEREKKDREAESSAGAQRGDWYGPDGRRRPHESVREWARSRAMAHRYTFQALLSVPEGRLTAADYGRAMRAAAGGANSDTGGQLDEWRMVVHDDTAHSHAHVLFFGDRRLEKERYLAWRDRVQEELAKLEEKQLDEQAPAQERAHESVQLNETEITSAVAYGVSGAMELE